MSQTYISALVTLVLSIGAITGFDVDAGRVTETLTALALIGTTAWTLYARYRAGGISAFGIRKN